MWSPAASCWTGEAIIGNLYRNNLDEIFTPQKYVEFYKNHWGNEIGEMRTYRTCDFYNSNSSKEERARYFKNIMRTVMNNSKSIDKNILRNLSLDGKSTIHGWVDSVSRNNENELIIRFWAADDAEDPPLPYVYVLIDGIIHEIKSIECEDRGDVREIHKKPNWEDSGIIMKVDIKENALFESMRIIGGNSHFQLGVIPGIDLKKLQACIMRKK
jgi:hypothetical protein